VSLSVYVVDERDPRNYAWVEPSEVAHKLARDKHWRVATPPAARPRASAPAIAKAAPTKPKSPARSGETVAQAAARHGITLGSRGKSRTAPRDWPEALDAGFSNAQLAAFIKAEMLPNPVHLRHDGVLHKYGPRVLRTMQERGFIGP
jgi:hypothetical protein